MIVHGNEGAEVHVSISGRTQHRVAATQNFSGDRGLLPRGACKHTCRVLELLVKPKPKPKPGLLGFFFGVKDKIQHRARYAMIDFESIKYLL